MTKEQDDLLMREIRAIVAGAKAKGTIVDQDAVGAMLAAHFDHRTVEDITRKVYEHARSEGLFSR